MFLPHTRAHTGNHQWSTRKLYNIYKEICGGDKYVYYLNYGDGFTGVENVQMYKLVYIK